jgi:[protein-PII] uridylyltransferase
MTDLAAVPNGFRQRLRRFLPGGRRIAAVPASGVPGPRALDILEPQTILDRPALVAALSAAGSASPAILDALRQALGAGRAEIQRRFRDEGDLGDACVAETAFLFDGLIRTLADVADRLFPAHNPTLGERFAILAVGGYGRGEMAPFSDIDLLFLLPYKRNPRIEQIVEFMLYKLWDLGLKVGHAVRPIDECLRLAKSDVTICTTLLETALIWGEPTLYDDLKRRFRSEVAAGNGGTFTKAKLAERDARHRRMGDSRYVLEPNVKESKGGLRDLQTLIWIGEYLHGADDLGGLVRADMLRASEARIFQRALSFFRTVRCHLHYLSGRGEDRLTFDVQPEVARRMGYTDHAGTRGVERLMKHYFLVAKDVGDLTRIFLAAIEAEARQRPKGGVLKGLRTLDGFALDGERLTVLREDQFREHPVDLIRLFRVAQKAGFDIHPTALRLVTRSLAQVAALRQDAQANALFLEILTATEDPEITLRRMNEAGVLARFIPDFGRVVAQMQFDMYHRYTVDEHTLFAIGILHRIETGALAQALPLAADLVRKIRSRRALYVALFCHDIAKGRGGDHSVIGAGIAAALGPRLGLTEEETETAEWLVRWHLVMSDTAVKRDLDDPKTVQDFVALVESPERLRLLTVLTTADINAVGEGRWTTWKAVLMSELYYRADELLSGGLAQPGKENRIAAAKDRLRAALAGWPADAVDRFVANGSAGYWLAFDAETHARHARIVREAALNGAPLMIDTRIDRDRAVTELTIHTGDHPGLFSRLAGAIAVSGGDVVDARIFTFQDGTALDVFQIQDATSGEAFDAPDKLAKLSVAIDRSLAGELRVADELDSRRRARQPSRFDTVPVARRVLIDNEASRTHTVVEVNGRDRPGLLYALTRALTMQGIQISSAKISTFGTRAVDVFYVKDVFGLKVTHERKLQQVRQALMTVLQEPETTRATAQRAPGLRRRAARAAATAQK